MDETQEKIFNEYFYGIDISEPRLIYILNNWRAYSLFASKQGN